MEHFSRTSIQKIKSGDVLFFSNNTPTGLTLRTFTSTLWSHTGIAIRLKGKRNPRISIDEKGKLYVMEINARVRYDRWTDSQKSGFGLSQIEYVLENQTIAAVRFLKEKFRTKLFKELGETFIDRCGDVKFPKMAKPFIGAWLGYPTDKLSFHRNPEHDSPELFCSEMMIYFYIYTVISQFKTREDPIEYILGKGCPHRPDIVAPRHFEPHHSSSSKIFEPQIHVFARQKDDSRKTLMFPLLFGVVMGVVFWSALPGNSWEEMSQNSAII